MPLSLPSLSPHLADVLVLKELLELSDDGVRLLQTHLSRQDKQYAQGQRVSCWAKAAKQRVQGQRVSC